MRPAPELESLARPRPLAFAPPRLVLLPLLGDIVICAPLVGEEARSQHKRVMDHWAHLTVHGVLHLLGHDHRTDEEAGEMEALETRILTGLGCADPWRI